MLRTNCRLAFTTGATHSATFEFSLLAHLLQMLLASKINSHISSNFCQDHQDGRWISKALNANYYKLLWVISLAPMQTRSPFFYYVFYTIVFTGFVYFTLVETLDSTLHTIHYVVYTSWTSCFLHTFSWF